jgi:hypothetical protein
MKAKVAKTKLFDHFRNSVPSDPACIALKVFEHLIG